MQFLKYKSVSENQSKIPYLKLYKSDNCIYNTHTHTHIGFSDGTSAEESVVQRRGCKRCSLDPWVRKVPWRRKWQPTPVFLHSPCSFYLFTWPYFLYNSYHHQKLLYFSIPPFLFVCLGVLLLLVLFNGMQALLCWEVCLSQLARCLKQQNYS